ncbi:MAG TPA: biotin/lipoyl-containing protein [Streptosporangiaceae bacterium]|nr:biotin/lipoyl-containing protein [Streptosporangiaceae bacterium]
MSSEGQQSRPRDARIAVQIAEVCERAQVLASAIPGPLLLLRVRAGDASVEVRWQETAARPAGAGPGVAPGPGGDGTAGTGPEAAGAVGEDSGRTLITAPMVGTFYRAPSPGGEPLVKPGDVVAPGQTVGIVEAMKLMNSVTAECAGQVMEVLAEDGAPVEFGQPLLALTAVELADAVSMTAGP